MPKAKLTALQKDNLARVKKNKARVRAYCNQLGKEPPGAFAAREAEYLKAHPHLAKHKHCGLAPDSDNADKARKVVLPNGLVIFSTWYKVPTSDADHRRADREAAWMNSMGSVRGTWAEKRIV